MDYYLLAQIVNGVIFGLIYALIALGLTIVFSIMRVVNFSHGEFYMIGGYTLYALTASAVTFFSIPLSLPAWSEDFITSFPNEDLKRKHVILHTL